MSKFIDRDINRTIAAAHSLGMSNIEKNVTGPNRWRFHIKAIYHNRTILMAFDPRHRPTGGARPERIKSFLAKKDWAQSSGYDFYSPSRYHTTPADARYALQKWMKKNGMATLR